MTNYNERLDRVLSDYAEAMGSYVNFGSPFNSDEDNIAGAEALYQTSQNEAKQALTSLIKELVAEAKPEMPYEKLKSCPVCGEPQYNHSGDVHFDYGVNQYEENLLKALEEV